MRWTRIFSRDGLALALGLSILVTGFALMAPRRSEAKGPVPLTERECATMLGGEPCTTGDANCGCTDVDCGALGDCVTTFTTCYDNGTQCVKIFLTPNNVCGQVNTSFPNGCASVVDPDNKCAEQWVAPYLYIYGSKAPCTYPAGGPDVCQGLGSSSPCGGNKTTCNQFL